MRQADPGATRILIVCPGFPVADRFGAGFAAALLGSHGLQFLALVRLHPFFFPLFMIRHALPPFCKNSVQVPCRSVAATSVFSEKFFRFVNFLKATKA